VNPQPVTGGGGYMDTWTGGLAPLLTETANGSLGVLFDTNRAASVATKVFTPNLDANTPWFKRMLTGTVGEKAQQWLLAEKGNYDTIGGKWKVHGWLAVRGEAAVGASWITDQGVRMRSGTISLTMSVQPEAIGELNLPQGDIRVLATENSSVTLSYSITTTEDRLEDIMTGRVEAPDPFTLEGMLPGDSITIVEGYGFMGEAEGRALLGKGPLRAGLDVKGDHWEQSGHKITVKMVENPDPSLQNQPHVIVMDGSRDTSGNAIGFGLIWNPKIAADSTLGKYSQGNFVRGLLQVRDSDTVEDLRFIEINPYDTSAGGGADLYRRIVLEGVVDYDASTGQVPGALAHGTVSVDSEYQSATLQLTGYYEPRQKDSRNHVQFLSQYSIDLVAMIDDRTQMNIDHAEPGATVGDTGDMVVNARFSDGTSTNYFHRFVVNAANYTSEETFNLTAESVSREQMADALDTDTFENIRLHLKDGSVVEGQAAIDWLKSHEDGWFGGNDKVGVVVNMGAPQEANEFSANFIADQKSHDDAQHDDWWEKPFYWMGRGMQSSPEIALASLAAPDVFANPDQPWNYNNHQEAADANENFRAMAGSGMGNLLGSIDKYHEHAKRAAPYPVTVDVFVDWE
jgi:hypothetical protein